MADNILIVEDDPKSMKVLYTILKAHGYAPLQATDGEQAIEIAVKEKPDLIIMDIQIPKLSGVEVVKRLRQMPAFSNVPCVAVTAYAMKGDRERFLEAGFDAYLSKPYNTRELPKLAAEMLLKKRNNPPSQ